MVFIAVSLIACGYNRLAAFPHLKNDGAPSVHFQGERSGRGAGHVPPLPSRTEKGGRKPAALGQFHACPVYTRTFSALVARPGLISISPLEMAPTGQTRAQRWQPTHFSWSQKGRRSASSHFMAWCAPS